MTLTLTIITVASLAVAACAIASAVVTSQSAAKAQAQLLEDAATERQQAARVIQDLCQRIQAPHAAVAEHAAKDAQPDPPPVDLDDDAQMFEVRKEREQAWR